MLVSALRLETCLNYWQLLQISLIIFSYFFSNCFYAAYHYYEACTERDIHIRISLSSSDSPVGIPRTCTCPRILTSSLHSSHGALVGFLTWLKQTITTITRRTLSLFCTALLIFLFFFYFGKIKGMLHVHLKMKYRTQVLPSRLEIFRENCYLFNFFNVKKLSGILILWITII